MAMSLLVPCSYDFSTR